MTKTELLDLVNELKVASSKNGQLLLELQRTQKDGKNRPELITEIERINNKQAEIMSNFVSLCEDKELVDKFQNISEEKDRLFQKFADSGTESELKEVEKEITKIVELWVGSLQQVITTVLEVKN